MRSFLRYGNQIFLLVFILELGLRVVFLGSRQAVRQGWIWFDGLIILVGVFDQWILPNIQGLAADVAFISVFYF